MNGRLASVGVIGALLLWGASAWAESALPQSVHLRVLNKVTARVQDLEGSLETPLTFGRLTILVKKCWVSPPDERPEQAALLEIHEQVPDQNARMVFSGWMFASSPTLSALEHPVYDVALASCRL